MIILGFLSEPDVAIIICHLNLHRYYFFISFVYLCQNEENVKRYDIS